MKITLFFIALCYFYQALHAFDEVSEECSDIFDPGTCYSWLKEGMCSDPNFKYIAQNCQKTCHLCPVKIFKRVKVENEEEKEMLKVNVCQNKKGACLKWRKHCKKGAKFFDFMSENCRRACHFCKSKSCDDTTSRCSNFRSRGFCRLSSSNHNYMKKHCELSCGFCVHTEGENDEEKNKFRIYHMEFPCSFETNECDWINQIFDDTADWKVGLDLNGPRSGYRNSLKYMYLDAQYKGYFANFILPWNLVLPIDEMNRGNMCFHFMYQMTGGEIFVAERPTPSSAMKYPADIVVHRTNHFAHQWRHEKVNIRVTEQFHLVLKGVKGNPGTYIIIDNIFFTEGECY